MKTVQPVSSSRKPDTNILSVYQNLSYRLFAIPRSTLENSSKVAAKALKIKKKEEAAARNFPTSTYTRIFNSLQREIQRENWRFIVARRSRQSRARNNNWVGLVVFGYLLWGSRYFSTAWWLLDHCLSAGWLSSWLAGWRDGGERERELGNAGSYGAGVRR